MPTPGLLGACSRARLRLRALRALPARALPLPNADLASGSRGMGGAASWAASSAAASGIEGLAKRAEQRYQARRCRLRAWPQPGEPSGLSREGARSAPGKAAGGGRQVRVTQPSP
jgi:hypothetical protein